jgi:hypothetical protein
MVVISAIVRGSMTATGSATPMRRTEGPEVTAGMLFGRPEGGWTPDTGEKVSAILAA